MRPRLALAALTTLLAGACSPAAVLNAVAPQSGVTVDSDIAYAAGPRQRLDVYAPAVGAASGHGHPVVVFFYGGGWESGERGLYRFLGAGLAARGVVTVIPDYRVYPEIKFPTFMEDAALAVAWARRHNGDFGGDGHTVFLMGHSAGAQIAMLLALDGEYLAAAGLDTSQIAGVIGLAGPYDFLPLKSATLKAIFGPEAQWPRSQPINYVTPAAPPMLLAAGSDDTTVDPGNTRRLAARLRAAGAAVTETIYPGVGHMMLAGAFATPLAFVVPIRRDVLDFIGTQARPGD
jgi:acetyl esterase/lipase